MTLDNDNYLGIKYDDKDPETPVYCPKVVTITPHSSTTPDLLSWDETLNNYALADISDAALIGIHQYTVTFRNAVPYAYDMERTQIVTLEV